MVFCRHDLTDLVELCAEYLDNQKAGAGLEKESRLYFDRFLHRDQLAAYYLQQIHKFIG
jgi:hypothetical protein